MWFRLHLTVWVLTIFVMLCCMAFNVSPRWMPVVFAPGMLTGLAALWLKKP